ncbi:hypothetical protein [Burkholderia pseudomultivorans]|uniref:hypothetical protein n=1 Tax=Burkholderia pseudomultivorans TaxID=1207504 RepID=UPI001581EA61|nr:hypothetical protein [Burkholderia pseudomultivorans]
MCVTPDRNHEREPDMNKRFAAAVLALAWSGAAPAQDGGPAVDAPTLAVGDSWDYTQRDLLDKNRTTEVKVTVTAISGDVVSVSVMSGDAQPVTSQTDRSWAMSTEIDGEPSTYRYLDFPLTPGKRWQSAHGWLNRSGDPFEEDMNFTVAGPARVTVPAGTFDAIRIDGHGSWEKLDGRAHAGATLTIWYAPSVKRIVRYDSVRNGFMKNHPSGYSLELERYNVQ